MANYKLLIPFILRWEGGYTDDPDDLGGPTNRGITLKTLRTAYGNKATTADLRRMTDTQWQHIFKTYYWDRWQADRIHDQAIANILVDWTWASGVHAIRIPQRMLGVTPDGIVGSRTLNALNSHPDPQSLFNDIKASRVAFVTRICRSRPQNKKFRQGWLNRINALEY